MQPKTSKFHQNLTINYTIDLYGIALKKDDSIFLTSSCPTTTVPDIYENLLKSFTHDNKFCSYNVGMQQLKNEIRKYILSHSGFNVNPKRNILITLGATTFLQQLFMYLLDDEKECLVITPTFQDYFNQIRLTQCTISEVAMDEEKDKWSLNIPKIREAMNENTRMILLCSPNNPTGKIYTKEELKDLGSIAQEFNAYLVTDEAYNYLTYEKPFTSLLAIPEIRENVIVVRTFSKEFSMCGWRVGYTYVPEHLFDTLFHFQLSSNTVAPTISQKAAVIALQSDSVRKWAKKQANDTRKKRDYVCDRIRNIGKDLSFIKPDACPYLFVKYGKQISSYNLCKEIILKQGVLVSPGIGNGKGGEGHFCITFADCMDVIKEGLDRLTVYFEKYY